MDNVTPVTEPSKPVLEPVSMLAVVVLYRMRPGDSPALRSLLVSANALNQDVLRLKVLLYDNTPEGQEPGILPETVEYWAARNNRGLSSAYNFALEMAETEGFDWLVTLDQDTTVPVSYCERIVALTRELSARFEIAGLVPEIWDHGTFISPHVSVRGRSRRLPQKFVGVTNGEITAINSGAVWRTRSLREIGGFHPLFWLDYLDHWLFHVIQHAGKLIYVVGDLDLEHELSLLKKNHQLSSERLAEIFAAESAFYDLYKSPSDGWILTAKLFGRISSQILKGTRRYWHVTWSCLVLRLFCGKEKRIAMWERKSRHRLENSSQVESLLK